MNDNLSTPFDRGLQPGDGIPEKAWNQAVQWLEQADALIITAGAGMGVDSGLPDFRGNRGLWRAYPALREAGLDFVRIASPRAFRRDPELAWGFYGHRLNLYRDTVPHEGFGVLHRWAARMKHGAFVYTSNVDGHFQKAGFHADRIVECHGSLHWLQCMNACTDDIWPAAEAWVPKVDEHACRLLSALPRCSVCAGLVRPNVLMFDDGEWLPERTQAQHQRLDAWLSTASNPVVVELGAGTAVPAVRWFGSTLEAPMIRINLRESEVDRPLAVGLAGRGLPVLVELDRRWA